MKNRLNKFLLIIALAGIFLNFGPVFSIDNTAKGSINSYGYTSRMIFPDTAYVLFSVVSRDKGSQKALSFNNQKTSAIFASLKPLLSKNERISTSSYSVNPYYEYNNLNKKNEIQGYEAYSKITVKLKDIQKVGKIIDFAISKGSDRIEGVEFRAEDTESICEEMLIEAALEARKKAQLVSSALGAEVDGIKNISSPCSANSFNRPVYAMAKDSFSSTSEASYPSQIEASEIKIGATVNAEFNINNKAN